MAEYSELQRYALRELHYFIMRALQSIALRVILTAR